MVGGSTHPGRATPTSEPRTDRGVQQFHAATLRGVADPFWRCAPGLLRWAGPGWNELGQGRAPRRPFRAHERTFTFQGHPQSAPTRSGEAGASVPGEARRGHGDSRGRSGRGARANQGSRARPIAKKPRRNARFASTLRSPVYRSALGRRNTRSLRQWPGKQEQFVPAFRMTAEVMAEAELVQEPVQQGRGTTELGHLAPPGALDGAAEGAVHPGGARGGTKTDHAESGPFGCATEGPRGKEVEVSRRIQIEPGRTELLVTKAVDVRREDHEGAIGLQDSGAFAKEIHGIMHVLQHVGGKDGVEAAIRVMLLL